jgi:hypothetical protein
MERKPDTNFTFVVYRATVHSCIYFVIGGVAKNFLPLLLKALKIKKIRKALKFLVIKHAGIL